MNVGIQIADQVSAFNSFEYIDRSEIAASCVNSMQYSDRNHYTAFHSSHTIPINSAQGFQFLFILSNTYFLIFFGDRHPKGCKFVSYYTYLISIFLIIMLFEHLFMCLLAFYTFLEKCLFKFFAHFLIIKLFGFLLLSFRSSLYILDVNPYCIFILQILSPILWVILFIVSFDVQNVLIFMKCNLSVFSFIASDFGIITKKSVPNPVL